MIVRACLVVFMVLAGTSVSLAQYDDPHPTLGACGGYMTGYNGQQYPCQADRRPACDPVSRRCVCLERLDCGGRRNEPF